MPERSWAFFALHCHMSTCGWVNQAHITCGKCGFSRQLTLFILDNHEAPTKMPLRRKLKNLIPLWQPSRQSGGSSLVPEASYEDSLPQMIDDSTVIALNSKTSSTLIEGDKNYDIKTLYDHDRKAYVDIVFVHELIDDAYNTWLDKKTGIHWSSKLLRHDIPKSRILSFEYDSNVINIWASKSTSSSRLFNYVENLIDKLVRERERNETEIRKIIFVAHNLGELISKQALTHFKNNVEKHLNQIEHCIIEIIFLRVSHCEVDFEA